MVILSKIHQIKNPCKLNLALINRLRTKRYSTKTYNYELSTQLYDGLIAEDRFSLSRAITLVESSRQDHQSLARELIAKLQLDHSKSTRSTFRIGLSGSPGVGKSTFIEAFGMYLIDSGLKAVDPSSAKTGGSILGDKTRMPELSKHDDAYVRPSPSRGTLGGVARNTNEAILLCEAGGYDVVLVETVGVGQSETVVADMVDMFVLLVPPAGGDELQGMKKGIVEMSDLIIVNKADGDLLPAANRAKTEYISAIKFLQPNTDVWKPKVISISALGKVGIADTWKLMQEFDKATKESGHKKDNRGKQQIRWLWREVTANVVSKMHQELKDSSLPKLEKSVYEGKLTAGLAGEYLVSKFLNPNSTAIDPTVKKILDTVPTDPNQKSSSQNIMDDVLYR